MADASDARSIERLAREALVAYDLPPVRLSLTAGDWNHTFRVDAADGRAYALRIYRSRRRSDDEIRAEIRWLDSLAAAGFRVPRPIRAGDGSAFVRVGGEALHGRRVALFGWVPGRPLADDPGPSRVPAFGETIARLHEHGRAFEAPEGLTAWDSPFPRQEQALFNPANRGLLDPSAEATFRRASEAAADAIARLRASGEPARLVHGDLHEDNVLVDGEDVWVIDFDDCMLAWPVQDLGVTMWEMGEDEATWPFREALREGYERVAPWPERYRGEIDVFAANRGLLKADDVLQGRNRRSHDDIRASIRRHAEAIEWFLRASEVG